MLDLGLSETSQNFSSIRQLFEIVSQEKPKEKCWKIAKTYTLFFYFVSFGPPWKKNCLKELKFLEDSENPKFTICWKFQLSISKPVGSPHFCGVNISNWGSPFLFSLFATKYAVVTFCVKEWLCKNRTFALQVNLSQNHLFKRTYSCIN